MLKLKQKGFDLLVWLVALEGAEQMGARADGAAAGGPGAGSSGGSEELGSSGLPRNPLVDEA